MKRSRKFKFGAFSTIIGVLVPATAFALTIQVGMVVNLGWNVASNDAPQVMTTLSTNNIKTVRQFFNWSVIQPTSASSYDWRWIDIVMKNAAANGVGVLPVFYFTPGWANNNQGLNVLPSDTSLYTNFVKATFQRYGRNGTFWQNYVGTPSPLVTAEIWNEPWCKAYLKSTDPVEYANLVRATATAIRSIDPSVKILASSDWYPMSGTNKIWLPAFLAAMPDYAKYVDVANVHLYFPNFSIPKGTDSYSKLPSVRNALTKAGLNEPIWITESGVNARMIDQYELGQNNAEISSTAYSMQADAYVAILNTINSMATQLNIERYYAFLYQRTPATGTSSNDGFSLADKNLQPTVAAKAIFSWVATHPAV